MIHSVIVSKLSCRKILRIAASIPQIVKSLTIKHTTLRKINSSVTVGSIGQFHTNQNTRMSSKKSIVAVCQMTSTSDKNENFKVAESLIHTAQEKGAVFAFLPECFDYLMTTTKTSLEAAEDLDGNTIKRYRDMAKECNMWLSLGGFHRKTSDQDSENKKLENLHVIIDNQGEIKATYAKTHLFDIDIEGKVKLKESNHTIAGDQLGPPLDTPIGRIGLQICYDVRFSEASSILRQQGADILTYPSAFTVPTGRAHWQTLLQCRAIENQCYVIAAAQVGRHNEVRTSYGHAMIIDPWGKILADCGEDVGICTAEIDLDYVNQVRTNMPMMLHRRTDLYQKCIGGDFSVCKSAIDDQPFYTYGHVKIASSQVFYRSQLSYACVNIKPVLPGHILVVPLRSAERLSNLSPPEVTDLFMSVQKISDALQKHHKSNSVTIAVQDGPESGQTIKHVHVHVIPRHPNDIPFNDEIYNKLQSHDKDMTDKTKLRTETDMEAEAAMLRQYFRSVDPNLLIRGSTNKSSL